MSYTTEIKDNKFLVKHPSGVISIYTRADIRKFRDEKQAEIDRLKSEIAQDNILILSMEA